MHEKWENIFPDAKVTSSSSSPLEVGGIGCNNNVHSTVSSSASGTVMHGH